MSYWFFLSYARDNLEPYLKRFYRELNATLRNLTARGEGEDGFFDVDSIELGKQWTDVMTETLQNCRAFIALYSPAYFTSEFCGKEWQVFSARQAAYSDRLASPSGGPALMMPVLWVPESRLPNPLPDAVSAVQYKHSDFGEVYAREGLRQLMALSKYRDHYRAFLNKFAERLIQAAQAHPLPSLPHPPPVDEVRSAFHARGVKLRPEPAKVGPRFVQFVFVAGRRDELRAVREKLDPYGEAGGYDWHPYLPEVTDEMGDIAQQAASMEKLLFDFVPLADDIIKRIEEAERQNQIVAIVVDTWTLRLQQYHTFMREYDRRKFLNCVVLVPWNKNDDEEEICRSTLVDALRLTFQNHAILRDPNCFLDWISSPDELMRELRAALNKARTRIIEKAEVVKKAEGEQVIGKPVITGVRRASA